MISEILKEPFVIREIYEHIYSMENNWTMLASLVLVAGMTLTVLIIVFLLKAKKTFSQRLLAVFFGSCFFFLLYYYGYLYRSYPIGGIAVMFGNGLGFLLGPLLYFYVKSLAVPKEHIVKPLSLHLIPYFICWISVSVPVAINIWDGDAFQSIHDWYVRYSNEFIIVENVFLLTYVFFTLKLIQRLKNVLKESYSTLDQQNLKWCRDLLIGLVFILMADICFSIYEMNYPPIPWNIGMITAFSFVGLFAYLGYKGMLQTQLLVPMFLLKSEVGDSRPLVTASKKDEEAAQNSRAGQLTNLDPAEIERLKKKLFGVIDEDQPYLESDLNLQDLADRIGISAKKLSELLNQHVKVSFYDLINNYRVEAVKEKLLSPEYENLTLLAVAFDSGFKSKTSFNRIFKLKTGLSPSEYKKRIHQNVVAAH